MALRRLRDYFALLEESGSRWPGRSPTRRGTGRSSRGMHGGGSPDGARLAIKGLVDWEAAVTNARRIAGVTRELPDPR